MTVRPEGPSNCPHCGSSLIKTFQRGDKTDRYRREFGVEISGVYDGVLFWACPDCAGTWHRFPEGDPYRECAEPYMARYTETASRDRARANLEVSS